jgi:tricarballylate dehydrogenase
MRQRRWLHERGIRFRLMYDRQSFPVHGKWKFWGGLVLGTVGGGKGLVKQHTAAASRSGIRVLYENPVAGLLREGDGSVEGVVYRSADGARHSVRAGAVVLAAGGFEANFEMRVEHLGAKWRQAKVYGTPWNTGEVLGMALEAGAQRYGQWGGRHESRGTLPHLRTGTGS